MEGDKRKTEDKIYFRSDLNHTELQDFIKNKVCFTKVKWRGGKQRNTPARTGICCRHLHLNMSNGDMSLAISILVLKSTKRLSMHFTALSRKLFLAHLVLEQKHQPNNQRWTDNESRAPKHLKNHTPNEENCTLPHPNCCFKKELGF